MKPVAPATRTWTGVRAKIRDVGSCAGLPLAVETAEGKSRKEAPSMPWRARVAVAARFRSSEGVCLLREIGKFALLGGGVRGDPCHDDPFDRAFDCLGLSDSVPPVQRTGVRETR